MDVSELGIEGVFLVEDQTTGSPTSPQYSEPSVQEIVSPHLVDEQYSPYVDLDGFVDGPCPWTPIHRFPLSSPAETMVLEVARNPNLSCSVCEPCNWSPVDLSPGTWITYSHTGTPSCSWSLRDASLKPSIVSEECPRVVSHEQDNKYDNSSAYKDRDCSGVARSASTWSSRLASASPVHPDPPVEKASTYVNPCPLSAVTSQPLEDQDLFLVQSRQAGLTYKEIKEKGNFTEKEPTLRGRYRTLTKQKEFRVRKPKWKRKDVSLIKSSPLLVRDSALTGRCIRNCSSSRLPKRSMDKLLTTKRSRYHGNGWRITLVAMAVRIILAMQPVRSNGTGCGRVDDY